MPETPPLLGPGWDFNVFRLVGQAVLSGGNPYEIVGSFYPPGALLPFTLFAFVPEGFGYYSWVVLQIAIVLALFKIKRGVLWLFFMPVLFIIAAGQIDLALLALAMCIDKEPPSNLPSPFLAGIVTVKPQIAFLMLPWILVQWLRAFLSGVDRRSLSVFIGFTGIIHFLPILLVDSDIYILWFDKISRSVVSSAEATPGLFSLVNLGIPWEAIAIFIIPVALFAWLTKRERTARIINLLALPVGHYYSSVVLMGIAPWWLLVPVSWLALLLAHILGNFYPFMLMPLVALVWVFRKGMGDLTKAP